MSSEKYKLPVDGILGLESAFIKVPFEQLKRANKRAQKHTEKELGNVNSAISELARSKTPHSASNLKVLDSLMDKLKKLKRKIKEIRDEEILYTEKINARLDHLHELTQIKTLDAPAFASWTYVRLNRLLVEYMFRQGFAESANMLAKGTLEAAPPVSAIPGAIISPMSVHGSAEGSGLLGSDKLEKYADIEFFNLARTVENGLQARRCAEALTWCSENRTNLKKIKSTFEFNLRVQEFINFASKRELVQAVAYAKQHFGAFLNTNPSEIQQVVALLAFPKETKCEPYSTLYDTESRWQALLNQFKTDNYLLHALPPISALEMTMLAGLSGLKTAQCVQVQEKNPNCPVCLTSTYGKLAKELPLAHRANSSYVCRITGALMNEDNPPMATPDGYVYCLKAVQDMASKNHGQFRCPRTGRVYPLGSMKKLYLT